MNTRWLSDQIFLIPDFDKEKNMDIAFVAKL